MAASFNLQLDDLVYEYPDIKDPRFQTLISAKEEFRELSAQPTESVPNRGEFFRHQLLVHRYILMYDRLLLTHRTGTGKTCALGGSGEMFKRAMIHAASNFIKLYMMPERTHIKKVYILVKNETLELQFKQEIACKCSQPGDYITPAVLAATDTRSMRAAVSREINKFYKVTTYGAFARKIWTAGLSDQKLRQIYSGSLFMIDEIHNIRIDPSKPSENTDIRKTYEVLHRLFHVVDRSKVILATATPMTNVPGEIAPIMNLILPLDQQMPIPAKTRDPTGQDIEVLTSPSTSPVQSPLQSPVGTSPGVGTYDYTNPTLDFLEPFFRGRVSYVREADISAIVTYKGNRLRAEYDIGGGHYHSQQVIYATRMALSTPQNPLIGPPSVSALASAAAMGPGTQFMGQEHYYQLSKKSEKDAFLTNERHAANFVYPDGSYGGKGFNQYVVKRNRQYHPTPELRPWLQRIEYMRMLSSKFASIVELTMHPDNANKSVFCYTPYVKGSGAVELTLCFQGMGYELFTQKSSIFEASAGETALQYCPPTKASNPMIQIDRPANINKTGQNGQRPRVALFIGEGESKTLNANILEVFNSPENRHGEYIKVLIVSPVGREGINTANVQMIHIVNPEWTQAAMYQAISRVLRATSHVDLINERRRALIGRGDNPDLARVEVDIYQHAALASDGGSVDLGMYQRIEEKDIEIKRIERIMKQSAIDCHLHRARNIRPGRDLSAECDYDVCDYRCAHPPPDDVDYDSYDVLYSGPTVEIIIDEIKVIFKSEFGIPLSELYRRIDHRDKFIDMSIEKMITTKMRLKDRFGYSCYLREDKGIIFIQQDFPLADKNNDQNDFSAASYSQNMTAIDSVPLNKYHPEVGVVVQSQYLDQILRLEIPRDRFLLEQLLEKISLDTLISLVERLIEDRGNIQMLSEIQRIYFYYINEVNEPTQTIRETNIKLTQTAGGGRRVKETQTSEVNVIMTDTDTSGNPLVFYHTLNSKQISGSGYSETTDFFSVKGVIRLLKTVEGTGWRDANPDEQLVYTKLAQDRLTRKRIEFEQKGIYGIVLRSDQELRLVDMASYRRKMAEPGFVPSKKNAPRGKRRSGMSLQELYGILYTLHTSEPLRTIPIGMSSIIDRNILIQRLRQSKIEGLEEMPLDKLQWFDFWSNSGRTKADIYQILRRELAIRGAIWEI